MKKKKELQVWEYESEFLGKQRVCCTREAYLYLKLCYSKDGLTEEEYQEYKQSLK